MKDTTWHLAPTYISQAPLGYDIFSDFFVWGDLDSSVE